jgi:hypothetical protein
MFRSTPKSVEIYYEGIPMENECGQILIMWISENLDIKVIMKFNN